MKLTVSNDTMVQLLKNHAMKNGYNLTDKEVSVDFKGGRVLPTYAVLVISEEVPIEEWVEPDESDEASEAADDMMEAASEVFGELAEDPPEDEESEESGFDEIINQTETFRAEEQAKEDSGEESEADVEIQFADDDNEPTNPEEGEEENVDTGLVFPDSTETGTTDLSPGMSDDMLDLFAPVEDD